MQLRNLITFMHVAELGSFTKAAEQLGYTQSTVSFQITILFFIIYKTSVLFL